MPIYQYSMYFRDSDENTGWSEQVSQDVGSGQPFFVGSRADAARWAGRRAQFLSQDAQIDGIIARQVGSRRTVPYWFDAPYKGQAVGENTEAEVSIDYRLITSTNAAREYWIRSVPSGWVTSGQLTPDGRAFVQAAGNAYFTWLQGKNVGVRTTSQPKVHVDQIANAAVVLGVVQPIVVSVTKWPTGGANVPVNGDLVRVTGLRGVPYVNGVWKVDQVSGVAGGAVSFNLANSAKYQIGGAGQQGYVQVITPSVQAFTGAQFVRCGRHKTGKIFNQQRGRGSAKVLHSR